MINMGPFRSLSTVQLISSPSFSYLVHGRGGCRLSGKGGVFMPGEHGGEGDKQQQQLS